jgi:predicted amidohydrolase YtcJ
VIRALVHARIYHSSLDAVLIEDGVIQKLGTTAEIARQLSDKDLVVDLNGACLAPGFIDSHMHLLEYGQLLHQLQLFDVHSGDELLARVHQAAVQAASKDTWIIGRGFNEELFSEPGLPDKAALDAVSGEHPVALTRVCGHQMLVNSRAMELAGIAEDSTIDGGRIDYARGHLYETALNIMHSVEPVPSGQELKEWLLTAMKKVNSYGITSVGSDDFISTRADWKAVMDAFLQLSYQQKMTVRVREQCEFLSLEDFAAFLDEGYSTGIGEEFFTIGPLKLVTDGSLGARTAALSRPYADEAGSRGMMLYTDAEMRVFMELAARYNMPTICHAIGDRAVDHVLKLLEKVILPGNPLGHGLVHCQIMRPEQVQKICDMKLKCFVQTGFIDGDAGILVKRVGAKRAASAYPFHSLYQGTLVCNGSDAPVEEPDVMRGLQLAVTRTSLDGKNSMNPAEALSLEEALTTFLENGAKALEEPTLGSIAPGQKADLVVLGQDPALVKPQEIHTVPVLMTIVGGEVVYDASEKTGESNAPAA